MPNPDDEVDTDAQTGEKRKAEEFRPETVECGREILQDLSKGFTSWVEGREWLNMRLCV
jgi:nuclear cap-binding protein subunit 1